MPGWLAHTVAACLADVDSCCSKMFKGTINIADRWKQDTYQDGKQGEGGRAVSDSD